MNASRIQHQRCDRYERSSARWPAIVGAVLASLAVGSPAAPLPADGNAQRPLTEPAGFVDLASSGGGFTCLPSPIGAGTLPTVRSNAAGTVAWWYCATASGGWQVSWVVATADQMKATRLFEQAYAVLTADDPKAAFNAAVARNVKLPVTAPSLVAVWQPFAAQMASGAPPATKPARAVKG